MITFVIGDRAIHLRPWCVCDCCDLTCIPGILFSCNISSGLSVVFVLAVTGSGSLDECGELSWLFAAL